MKVSYLVPVFNKVHLIGPVLDGILSQAGDFERELIVVDDGSSDGSGAVIAERLAGISWARSLRFEDVGPATCHNRMAQIASGDVLKPCDGDDILLPHATLELLSQLARPEVTMAHAAWDLYEAATPPDPRMVADPGAGALREIENPLAELAEKTALALSGAAYPRWAWDKSGGCDERIFVHDTPLFLRLARLGPFRDSTRKIFLQPTADPRRWTHRQQGQVLHDGNKAMALFVADYPDLPPALVKRMFQRAAGRAWKWCHRTHGVSVFSSEYWTNLRSYLPGRATAADLEETCRFFAKYVQLREMKCA